MLAVNRVLRKESAFFYFLFAVILVIALKQFYSAANAAQLQWMLYPLVVLLELFSDLSFIITTDFVWQDRVHQISIVKSCAGVNFLIISLLGYLWLQYERPFSIRRVIRALILAWLTALLANTIRILLSIYTQSTLAEYAELSQEKAHLFIGIVVYFLCVWAQLSTCRNRNFTNATATAMLIYLSVTLMIPVLRAWMLGIGLPNQEYIAWIVGVPGCMVVAVAMLKKLR